MNRAFLVRHGENVANLTREFSHKLVDHPLTEKGRLQARQTAERAQRLGIEAIFASPLQRAHETAQIIAQQLGLKVGLIEELRELNVGSLELGPPTQAKWRVHDEVIQAWIDGNLLARFPDGENFLELLERKQRVLEAAFHSATRVMLVGHGGIFSCTWPGLCADAPRQRLEERLKNCAICEVEYIREAGMWQGRTVCWNDTSHMSGLALEPPVRAELPQEA